MELKDIENKDYISTCGTIWQNCIYNSSYLPSKCVRASAEDDYAVYWTNLSRVMQIQNWTKDKLRTYS